MRRFLFLVALIGSAALGACHPRFSQPIEAERDPAGFKQNGSVRPEEIVLEATTMGGDRLRFQPSTDFPGTYLLVDASDRFHFPTWQRTDSFFKNEQNAFDIMKRQGLLTDEVARKYWGEAYDAIGRSEWLQIIDFAGKTADLTPVTSVRLVSGWFRANDHAMPGQLDSRHLPTRYDGFHKLELPLQKNPEIADALKRVGERETIAFELTRIANDASKPVLRLLYTLAVLQAADQALRARASLDQAVIYGHTINPDVKNKVWTSGPADPEGYPWREVQSDGEHSILRATVREMIDGLEPQKLFTEYAWLHRYLGNPRPSAVMEVLAETHFWRQEYHLALSHEHINDRSALSQIGLVAAARRGGASVEQALRFAGADPNEPLHLKSYGYRGFEGARMDLKKYVEDSRKHAEEQGLIAEWKEALQKTRVLVFDWDRSHVSYIGKAEQRLVDFLERDPRPDERPSLKREFEKRKWEYPKYQRTAPALLWYTRGRAR